MGIDAGEHAKLPVRANLHAFVMIPAVDQIETIAFTMVFIGALLLDKEKGIHTVRGSPRGRGQN